VGVNEARNNLITQKSRSLENLTPTQASLEQNIKCASYQANCWNNWGWQKSSARWLILFLS